MSLQRVPHSARHALSSVRRSTLLHSLGDLGLFVLLFIFADANCNHSPAAVYEGLFADTPPAEVSAEPLGRNGAASLASKPPNLLEALPGVLFAFKAFDALSFCLFPGLCHG